MLLTELTSILGYRPSPLYREDDGRDWVAPEDQHWLRAARRAGAKGTYFFKTTPETSATAASVRPAVQVAQAETPEQARAIHRKLWNQGLHPFLIVLLPGQVRVYSGFAYDPDSPDTGAVTSPVPTEQGVQRILEALSAFTADAINRGDIWDQNAAHLTAGQGLAIQSENGGNRRRHPLAPSPFLQALLGSIRKSVALAGLSCWWQSFAFHASDLLSCVCSTSAEERILS